MQHLNSPLKRRALTEIVDALTKSFIAAIVGSVALSSAFGSSVQAAIATKPTANVGAAFCRQI